LVTHWLSPVPIAMPWPMPMTIAAGRKSMM
jgi:hypothetical protein